MIEIILNILIVIGVFVFMEGVAWFTHKYIMHGFMWRWHHSHHVPRKGRFERNDLFAVVFSLPSIGLFYYSTYYTDSFYLTSVAIGILAYGLFYFLFHDVLVHQRIKFRIRPKSKYLKRLINAHYAHHTKHTKEDCESFGFLFADKKYEKKEHA
ncbi:sterol desaturase family protein [Marinoscillum sp. MHG1-6]|uniref:sterol desaturase family protein n=1 Tax=Marinoscillum sp. MHG1-6 TaxID=2959627 RepID=UPI002157A26D|nr:sterol desaturase family protein [Marinoscillum sp. MHG1-6]